MPGKLLTIAIPTCNRAQHLELLLDVLACELQDHWHQVELLVFDNASSDTTPEVTAAFTDRCPHARVVRHAHNIGSAPNFLACLEAAEGRYFWLMGDDDAPVRGLLSKLLLLITEGDPDLVYLESLWAPDIKPLLPRYSVAAATARWMGRADFASRTNVYLTFISSIVVELQRLRARIDLPAAAAHMGAYFVQLSWTLGALRTGERFAVIDQPCVLATKGNSGGYGAITAFGAEFPKAVRHMLRGTPEYEIIMKRTVQLYLPGLTWEVRKGTAGAFNAENPWPLVRKEIGRRPLFWVLILPLGRFPLWLAQPFYQIWRVIRRLARDFARLRAQGTGRPE